MICAFCVVSDLWLISGTRRTYVLEVLHCEPPTRFAPCPQSILNPPSSHPSAEKKGPEPSACVLGARMCYRHYDKHANWWYKKGRLGVSCSVSWEGGFGPCSMYKNTLTNHLSYKRSWFARSNSFLHFCFWVSCPKKSFHKTGWIQSDWGRGVGGAIRKQASGRHQSDSIQLK